MQSKRALEIGSVAIIAIAGLMTLAFFVSNFPVVGPDAYHHLTNLNQYIALTGEGIFPPRWTPNSFRGFGAPMFYFYPPLVSMAGTAIHWCLPSNSLNGVLNLLALLSTIAAALTFRIYARCIGATPNAAWLGAVCYASSPYALYDVLFRSAYGEYLAFVSVPLVLLSVERAIRQHHIGTRTALSSMVVGAVGWTLLVLSSIPIAAVMGIASPIYFVLRARSWHIVPIAGFVGGIALAILCLGFYLLPAIQFHRDAHLHHVLTVFAEQPFHEFWLHHLIYGAHHSIDIIECLLFPLSLLLVGLLYRGRSIKSNTFGRTWLALTLLIIVLHLPWFIHPLLSVLPILPLIQSASRAYVLLSAGCAAWIAMHIASSRDVPARWMMMAIGAMTIGLGVYEYATAHARAPYNIVPTVGRTVFEYAPVQVPDKPDRIDDWAEQHQYDPETSSERPLDSTESILLREQRSNASIIDVSLLQPATIRFHRFYWPQWRLKASTAMRIETSADSNGVLMAAIPAGSYRLTLVLEKASSEVWGERVSMLGIAFIFALTIALLVKKQPWQPIG